MNKRKNRRRLIFSLLVVGILIQSRIKSKDLRTPTRNVVRTVHSKEERVNCTWFETEIPGCVYRKRKIQSYEIDDETIEHNPMGGIMFEVIINGDKNNR